MSEWQPIETAPDDGTPMLVTWPCTSGADVTVATKIEVWRDYYSGDHLAAQERPTHWMPLPEPPPNDGL